MTTTPKSTKAKKEGGGTDVGLLVAVEQLAVAHDRSEAERSDVTSSQNSAGDDGDNRDLNLPKE
ncbi:MULTISPECIES: hypothetical protein [Streptomyces]|uniref:hypothetical protein n=1 Tax=Streptomyces TaxID=1883 RepID=UPI00340F7822|nr:hypothetical protein OG496_54190 [Streptomyces sp. NBC_00988]